MENSELEFALIVNYPGISALNNENTKFSGHLQINGKMLDVSLNILENKTFCVKLDKTFKTIEGDINKAINSSNFKHPLQVLNKLTQLLKEHVVVEDFDVDLYRRVVNEYYQFNQYHLNVYSSCIAPDLSKIRITHLDEYRRKHNLEIDVNLLPNEGPMFKITKVDLPEEEREFESDDSLVELYKNVINTFKSYQDFFNLMDEIDKNCWVLDPESPSRKDVYRRIALNDKVSLIATFNPNCPNEMPKMVFMGPQNLASAFLEKRNKNFVDWDVNMHPLQEILKLLELEDFPGKPIQDDNEEELLVGAEECCMCFSLRLDNKLPELICPNTSCNRYFHINCLHQWLCSLQCRKVCDEIIGQCPSCEKNISCPIPKNL